MAQVKFIVDEELLKKFKEIVIKKRGKIELTPEGEEALRLYIQKYGNLEVAPRKRDPIVTAIGAIKTGEKNNALRDLKELETRH